MADAGDHLPARQGSNLCAARGSGESVRRQVFPEDVSSRLHETGHDSGWLLPRSAARGSQEASEPYLSGSSNPEPRTPNSELRTQNSEPNPAPSTQNLEPSWLSPHEWLRSFVDRFDRPLETIRQLTPNLFGNRSDARPRRLRLTHIVGSRPQSCIVVGFA